VGGRLVYKGLVGSESAEGWRKLRLADGSIWIGIAAALVAATITAARSRRLPAALGLLAGLVAAVVASAGLMIGWAAFGDRLGGLVAPTVRPLVALGFFAALLGAALGEGARSVAVALAARHHPAGHRAPVGWIAVGLAGVVALATVGAGAALAGGRAPVAADFR